MDRHSQEVDDLIRQYRNGEISRREFFRLGLALGGAAIYAALPTSAPAAVALAAPQKAAAPKRTDATIVLEERIESLDPHDHNGLTAHLLFKNIYDGLVDRNPVGRIVPALATEWKVIQPTVWEFTLRRGVTFTNGEPWNARAAKASIDRLVSTANWGTKRQNVFWRNVERGDIVNDYMVRVITKAPMGALLSNLAFGTMMPESIAKRHIARPITNQAAIVGTGPYKMTKWSPGQSVVIEANPTYWGPAKPKLQRVTINTIVEAATRIAGLQAGDADIAWALAPVQAVDQLRRNPNLQITSIDSLRIMWIGFTHRRKPFSDPTLREAAQRAVNSDTIARTVLVGEGKACQCVIAPGTFGAINDLDPNVISYNPDRSRELLRAAGFAAGDGPPVRFIAPVGSPQQVLEALVDQLNTVGFKARLELMEVGDYLRLRNTGECDLFANGFTAVTGDAEFIMNAMYYCGTARGGYCNKEVDRFLDEAAAETDQRKRLELYRKATELIWNDRADFWHYAMALHVGAKKGLTGLRVRPDNLISLQNLAWQG